MERRSHRALGVLALCGGFGLSLGQAFAERPEKAEMRPLEPETLAGLVHTFESAPWAAVLTGVGDSDGHAALEVYRSGEVAGFVQMAGDSHQLCVSNGVETVLGDLRADGTVLVQKRAPGPKLLEATWKPVEAALGLARALHPELVLAGPTWRGQHVLKLDIVRERSSVAMRTSLGVAMGEGETSYLTDFAWHQEVGAAAGEDLLLRDPLGPFRILVERATGLPREVSTRDGLGGVVASLRRADDRCHSATWWAELAAAHCARSPGHVSTDVHRVVRHRVLLVALDVVGDRMPEATRTDLDLLGETVAHAIFYSPHLRKALAEASVDVRRQYEETIKTPAYADLEELAGKKARRRLRDAWTESFRKRIEESAREELQKALDVLERKPTDPWVAGPLDFGVYLGHGIRRLSHDIAGELPFTGQET